VRTVDAETSGVPLVLMAGSSPVIHSPHPSSRPPVHGANGLGGAVRVRARRGAGTLDR